MKQNVLLLDMLDSDEAIAELIIEILDISSFRTAVNSIVVLMFELLSCSATRV